MKKPKYKQANSAKDLNLNEPMKSWKSGKTLVVKTKKPDGSSWVHHYDPYWVVYPEKPKNEKDFMRMVENGEIEPNQPVQSWKSGKKMAVLAKKGKEERIVHFGHPDYEDYTMHGDPVRRKNYLTRSAGIKDSGGKLTKNDKFSPNYWSREILW